MESQVTKTTIQRIDSGEMQSQSEHEGDKEQHGIHHHLQGDSRKGKVPGKFLYWSSKGQCHDCFGAKEMIAKAGKGSLRSCPLEN